MASGFPNLPVGGPVTPPRSPSSNADTMALSTNRNPTHSITESPISDIGMGSAMRNFSEAEDLQAAQCLLGMSSMSQMQAEELQSPPQGSSSGSDSLASSRDLNVNAPQWTSVNVPKKGKPKLASSTAPSTKTQSETKLNAPHPPIVIETRLRTIWLKQNPRCWEGLDIPGGPARDGNKSLKSKLEAPGAEETTQKWKKLLEALGLKPNRFPRLSIPGMMEQPAATIVGNALKPGFPYLCWTLIALSPEGHLDPRMCSWLINAWCPGAELKPQSASASMTRNFARLGETGEGAGYRLLRQWENSDDVKEKQRHAKEALEAAAESSKKERPIAGRNKRTASKRQFSDLSNTDGLVPPPNESSEKEQRAARKNKRTRAVAEYGEEEQPAAGKNKMTTLSRRCRDTNNTAGLKSLFSPEKRPKILSTQLNFDTKVVRRRAPVAVMQSPIAVPSTSSSAATSGSGSPPRDSLVSRDPVQEAIVRIQAVRDFWYNRSYSEFPLTPRAFEGAKQVLQDHMAKLEACIADLRAGKGSETAAIQVVILCHQATINDVESRLAARTPLP